MYLPPSTHNPGYNETGQGRPRSCYFQGESHRKARETKIKTQEFQPPCDSECENKERTDRMLFYPSFHFDHAPFYDSLTCNEQSNSSLLKLAFFVGQSGKEPFQAITVD
jgi:hypothetical protein